LAPERPPADLETGANAMQGHITKYRPDLGVGIIATEDGQRFRFAASSLVNPEGDLIAAEVDFERADGRADDIILLRGNPWTVFGASQRA
jgi:hypothetical protein